MPGKTREFGDNITNRVRLDEYHTRRDAQDALADVGVIGELAETLLRKTGYARHQWRTSEVRYALSKVSAYRDSDGIGRSDARVSALICALDSIGLGVNGDRTIRHPALRGLGSGRKNARDGGAWLAATRAARDSYPEITIRPVSGTVSLLVRDESGGETLVPTGAEALPSEYAQRLAQLAIEVYFGMSEAPFRTRLVGTPAEWQAFYKLASALVSEPEPETEAEVQIVFQTGPHGAPHWINLPSGGWLISGKGWISDEEAISLLDEHGRNGGLVRSKGPWLYYWTAKGWKTFNKNLISSSESEKDGRPSEFLLRLARTTGLYVALGATDLTAHDIAWPSTAWRTEEELNTYIASGGSSIRDHFGVVWRWDGIWEEVGASNQISTHALSIYGPLEFLSEF